MIKELTTKEFKEKIFDYTKSKQFKLKENKPVIICFSASWCGPCTMVKPLLEQLSEEYKDKVEIYSVDIDNEYEIASKFGIKSIPAVLYAPLNGDPKMMTGALPKKIFENNIHEVFNISKES